MLLHPKRNTEQRTGNWELGTGNGEQQKVSDSAALAERSTDSMPSGRKAVVLLVVLVLVMVLALAGYRYADMMMAEFEASDNAARVAQAKALADSGINYVAALLSNPEQVQAVLNNNVYDNPDFFRLKSIFPDELSRYQGRFSVIAPPIPSQVNANNLAFRFGVTDESGKINLNAMIKLDPSGDKLFELLKKLPLMEEQIAAQIVDWLDADSEVREGGGAENETYGAMEVPYSCKNGPLDSIEELLLIQDVTPELLYGNDLNRNGLIELSEQNAQIQQDPLMQMGWSAYLTIYSREQNITFNQFKTLTNTAKPKILLSEKDLDSMYKRLSAETNPQLANYIALYRINSGRSATTDPANTLDPSEAEIDTSSRPRGRIRSIYDLIDTEVRVSGSGRDDPSKTYACPLNTPEGQRENMAVLFDTVTTTDKMELPARININTAPEAVLATLPGLEENDLQTILAKRPPLGSDQWEQTTWQSPAWIATEAEIDIEKVEDLEEFITTRSQVYRVHVIGHFLEGGPAVHIEAVIDTNAGRPRILYRRDMTILGRTFDWASLGQNE
ncbi:MAG: type II secretion system protein GspK [Gemmataceae bacterium]